MNKPLNKLKCRACEGLEDKLSNEDLEKYMEFIRDWNIINNHHILKSFKFDDFKSALDFTNKVGIIAEQEGHHPRITLSWGLVEIMLFTHALNGLSLNDFILASKIDSLKL